MGSKTRVLDGKDKAAVLEAVRLLKNGELVAFPTETVYGLGADAQNASAVAKIFEAKARPSTNPVIVHVLDRRQAQKVVVDFPPLAEKLARAFWPGPLTLVLLRRPEIPSTLSGGGDTIAVRAPKNAVARALLYAFDGPIAAPSANRSMRISPTDAKHVIDELDGVIPLVLDDGPCELGIESTVLDLSEDRPRILRPGSITKEEIEKVAGCEVATGVVGATGAVGAAKSPGQLARHYAPKLPVRLLENELPAQAEIRAAVLLRSGSPLFLDVRNRTKQALEVKTLPAEPAAFAKLLYAALRWAERQNVDEIWIEKPPGEPAWAAVLDRLQRSAASPQEP